ncbi:MAG: alpha/beta fold hydrolase, partial [Bacteroidales bacterium]|nr:alpha/beta fold hydrolase [Bacteroidales bacterium]
MIHYTTYKNPSSPDWLLCIHGIGGNSVSWSKQIPFFKEHFNLLVIDLPGHGRSKNTDFASRYSLQVLCEYIHEVVSHHQLNKIHILGMSIGAIIALKFSELYPAKTKSLVLSGTLLRLSFPLKLFFYGSVIISSIVGYFTYYKIIAHFLLPEENQLKLPDKMAREAISKQ